MASSKVLHLDRIRQVEKPFGWLPFRLVSTGLFAELSVEAKVFYTFLCLVADRQGVSFYRHAALLEKSGLSLSQLERARHELCYRDLIAFDGHIYQVLSLPQRLSRDPRRRVSSAPEVPEVIVQQRNMHERISSNPMPTQSVMSAPQVGHRQVKADIATLMAKLRGGHDGA